MKMSHEGLSSLEETNREFDLSFPSRWHPDCWYPLELNVKFWKEGIPAPDPAPCHMIVGSLIYPRMIKQEITHVIRDFAFSW